MLIKTRNILSQVSPKTYLLNTEVAGTTVLRFQNTNGFGSAWAVQVGETGHEQSEVLVLSGDPGAGTLGTTTATSRFEHPANTPVYAIKYNQVIFERSTTGTAGTATPMTNGTVTYQADSLSTVFDDTTGVGTYAYRARFQNALGSSSQSDWITPDGFVFYSLARLRERTKDKLWDASFIKDDSVIDNWTNEFKDRLTNAAIQTNEDYALGTVDMAFGTAGLGTVTTSDFKQPRRVWVTYNGQGFYESQKMESNDDYPDRVYVSTNPHHYWVGNDIIQVKPEESGGTARVMFYRLGTPMQNDTDELPRYMRGYTDKFVEYNLLQAQYKDNKISYSEKRAAENSLIGEFAAQLTPRDKSGPDRINLVEVVSSFDNLP